MIQYRPIGDGKMQIPNNAIIKNGKVMVSNEKAVKKIITKEDKNETKKKHGRMQILRTDQFI